MAADVISLAIYFDLGPQPAQTVLHFRSSEENDPNPDVEAQACIAAFLTEVETLYLACIPSDVYLKGYKARRINNGGGPSITVIAGPEPGTRAGSFSVGAAGPCLVWGYEKLGGGWAAGRTFVPGVSEADIAQNQISDPLIGALQDFIEEMLEVPTMSTSMPAYDFEFIIWSSTHNASSGVETGTISGRPGIQRRRMKPSL